MKRLYELLLIREGEPPRVLYMLGVFLLVGMGMAIGRSSADALFLKRYGVEYLPVMYLLMSLLLVLVSTVYAAFADRLSPESFFRILFAALSVVVFANWAVMTFTNVELVYPIYFLVYEVSSELLLVHSAHYLGQNLNTLQAKRLSSLIYAGAQTGSIAGGLLIAVAVSHAGVQNLLLVWCVLLLVGMMIMRRWHRREGTSSYFRPPRKTPHRFTAAVNQIEQGIRFTRDSSLLRSASYALFFMVIAFYILCYSVNRLYTQTFTTEGSLTQFFGVLTAITSTIALLTQLFVTNRAIERFGVRRINLLFPLTTLASLLGLMFHYALPMAVAGSLNKDALMPAFRNPVRTLFYNILPHYMQGRARAVSVVVVLPLALSCVGLLLWLMQQHGNPGWFLAPGAVAALLYYYFNLRMNRAYVSTLISNLRDKLFLSGEFMSAELPGSDAVVLGELVRGVSDADDQVCLVFAHQLVRTFPAQATAVVLNRAGEAGSARADQLIRLLQPPGDAAVCDWLWARIDSRDWHLRATLLRGLIDAGDARALTRLKDALQSHDPRMRAVAIHGFLCYPHDQLHPKGESAWRALLSGTVNECLAALDLIADLECLPAQDRREILSLYHEAALRLICNEDITIKRRALTRLGTFRESFPAAFATALADTQCSEDPGLRKAAAGCVHLVEQAQREAFITRALDDGHAGVRNAAIASLQGSEADYAAMASRHIIDNLGTPRSQQALLESLLKLDLPNPLFKRIAVEKSRDACRLKTVIDRLVALDRTLQTAMVLLKYTLEERMQATVKLALLALEPLFAPGVVAAIRAGIASGDERHIANAVEAVHSLDEHDVTPWLLNALGHGRVVHVDTTDRELHTLADVLEWCRSRQDDWLNLCADTVRMSPRLESDNA